ncbi:MAG: hypothetical protein CMO55_19130 [Verrucomicrobiales bacterium]|nr:hypothetical protein [Verrucomicrobiales bacterium]
MQKLRIAAIAGIAAIVLPGCALQVKVREDWQGPNHSIPLDSTVNTWQEIRSGRLPATERLHDYNHAVRNAVVQIAQNWETEKQALSVINTTEGKLNLRVDPINVRAIGLVDEVVPADFVRVKKGLETETEVEGVGASLLVRQQWTEQDPMIPKTGLWYPVTAVLNLDQPRSPILELYDPTKIANLSSMDGPVPLAVDYTAPFARDFQDRQFQFLKVPAFLKYEKFADRMGIHRVSAFDPEKTACILVHGIYSSPVTWKEALNGMYENQSIRERYEFWSFGYPTGAPIPYLAAEFRKAVEDLIAFRRSRGAKDLDLVIIGHSMGGLLAKAATQHSGDEDWNKFFTVPIEQLEVKEKDREVLRNLVYYEPIPEIEKVIFCAVPHRGSKVPEKAPLKLVGDLVQLPNQLAQLSKDIVKQSRNALTPLGMEVAKAKPSSLDQLRESSFAAVGYLDKPLNPNVQYFSIIGCKEKDCPPLDQVSDGVVPYSSAHIEGVVSEKIVTGSPHGVHRQKEGIQEIVRILNLP